MVITFVRWRLRFLIRLVRADLEVVGVAQLRHRTLIPWLLPAPLLGRESLNVFRSGTPPLRLCQLGLL